MPTPRKTDVNPEHRAAQMALRAAVRRELLHAINNTDISDASLAANVGLTQPRISRVLRNDDPPNLTLDTLAELASGLGYDVQVRLRSRDEEMAASA